MNYKRDLKSWLYRQRSTFFGVALTAASQFTLAYLTLSIQSIYPAWSSPFWPASGAALAACLLKGPSMLLGVYLGLTLPNLTLWAATPKWIGFVLPLGNLAETAAAWALLQIPYGKFDYRFISVRDVGRFLFLAPWIPAALSAVFVQTSLLIAGITPPERYLGEILVFWLGNSTGIMLTTPLILVWRDALRFQWNGNRGRRILFLLLAVGTTLSLFHASNLPNHIRMTAVLIIPLVVWGIWSTGFRGATLLCLLTSFFYFAFDVPASRPLTTLLNEKHLQANISFISNRLNVDSPMVRPFPPTSMLDAGLEQIGILTAICLTLLPLGAASDELRKRGEQDDLVLQALDSSFWTWNQRDGVHFFNHIISGKIGNHPILFQASQPSGKVNVPAILPDHPGYISHWTVTDRSAQGEPLTINGILQSRVEASRRQEAEAQAELANLEIRALRAHLNPHLIFNCLTGLRGMIKANPDLARDFTGRLARFLRAVVDSQVSTLITLSHELEICQDYIQLESARGRSIALIHRPNPSERNIFIPPLSLVTLVENAVKHGTPDPAGRLTIQFECRSEKDHSTVMVMRHSGRICDNGKGTAPGGLSLLRQQLKTSYTYPTRVDLVELPDQTVEARIHLLAGAIS